MLTAWTSPRPPTPKPNQKTQQHQYKVMEARGRKGGEQHTPSGVVSGSSPPPPGSMPPDSKRDRGNP